MSRSLSKRVKARRSYGRHIERLCDGHSTVLIHNPSEALNLKKFIKNNSIMHNLVVEPQRPGVFSLTWHMRPPRKTGETENYLWFELGDMLEWP